MPPQTRGVKCTEMTRITGIIVLILSLALAIFSAYAFVNADGMAQMLSLGIKKFNAIEWRHHWKLISMSHLIIGCLGFLSGIGMIKKRRWGVLTIAVVTTLYLLSHALAMVGGYAIYEFERMNIIEALVFLLLCIYFWYLHYSKGMEKNT
jgi:hypothetical protein